MCSGAVSGHSAIAKLHVVRGEVSEGYREVIGRLITQVAEKQWTWQLKRGTAETAAAFCCSRYKEMRRQLAF
jgi:hypothetical protein